MVDVTALASVGSGAVDAALLIGAVLLEAALLYVGYGALEQVAGQAVVAQLRGE